MYSMLNSQMIRANQAELAQREYMAEHRHAVRELRSSSPRRAKRLKRLALAGVSLAHRQQRPPLQQARVTRTEI
jgi:hypothetical protein